MKNVLILGGLLIASLSFAETDATVGADAASTTESASGTSTVVAPVPATSGVVGSIELRPSVQTNDGTFRSENQVQLGYAFSKTRSLKLVSDFNTMTQTGSNRNGGFNAAVMQTLHTRLSADDLFTIPGSAIKFGFQNRIYAPVEEGSRGRGHITTIRNYGNLSAQVGAATMTLSVVPIFHIYNTAGTGVGTNATANPVFENRVYLMSDISLGKVTISPAIWWGAKKHREYAFGATNNGGWTHHGEFDLDVTYAVAEKVNVGLGFYTGNLLGETAQGFSNGFAIGDGFRTGVAQVILNASL